MQENSIYCESKILQQTTPADIFQLVVKVLGISLVTTRHLMESPERELG